MPSCRATTSRQPERRLVGSRRRSSARISAACHCENTRSSPSLAFSSSDGASFLAHLGLLLEDRGGGAPFAKSSQRGQRADQPPAPPSQNAPAHDQALNRALRLQREVGLFPASGSILSVVRDLLLIAKTAVPASPALKKHDLVALAGSAGFQPAHTGRGRRAGRMPALPATAGDRPISSGHCPAAAG